MLGSIRRQTDAPPEAGPRSAGIVARPPVSCLVFTLNEEVNLPHCLASLAWCDDVVVVDSYSTDRTRQISREAGARFVQHEFTGFGDQRNWVMEHVTLRHDWALILDADERVPDCLAREIDEVLHEVADGVGAFRLRRRFCLWGKWLRYSSLYPTWVVRLVRLGRVEYVNRGHAETQVVRGEIRSLRNDLIDENHKGIDAWWRRQARYAVREASYEMSQPALPLMDMLSLDPLRRRAALKSLARRVPARPAFYFLYCYFLRFGLLDGMAGLRFAMMKATYQGMIANRTRRLRKRNSFHRSLDSHPEGSP